MAVVKMRKTTIGWAAVLAGAALLPQFPHRTNAQSGDRCNADEIHWSIDGPRSIGFNWRGEASRIRFGVSNTYGKSASGKSPNPMPFSSPGPFRQVLLKGLKPGTIYHYAIGNCGDRTFHTPPEPGTSGFVVDVEGDIGTSTTYRDVVPNQKLVASDLPALVLILGDLTYGNPNGQQRSIGISTT